MGLLRWSGLVLLGAMVAAPVAGARDRDEAKGKDHAGVFTTMNITEDEPAGDVACVFCTVNIDGDVHGDVAVVFGTVNVASDRVISGDMATVFSTARFAGDNTVRGDLANVFSNVEIPSSVRVGGGRSMVGSGFGMTVLFAPLLLLAGLIWLLVFAVRELRPRYRGYPTAARRF